MGSFNPGFMIMMLLRAVLLVTLILMSFQLAAQDIEPRRWALLPSGMNFVGVGSVYSHGDIFFDPLLQVEDGKLDYAVLAASYIRSFEIFGETARIDISIPYASGRWEGLVQGVQTSLRRQGFLDPSMRLTWNFYGAPAMGMREFGQYVAQNPVYTTAGIALGVIAPLGEYFDDKLINLGNNRWTLRPQIGALHQHNKWQFETTAAVFLYADNDEFIPGARVREQDPRWSFQAHTIYTFRPGLWASVSGGVLWGGESAVDGAPLGDRSRVYIWAVSMGVPLSRTQGLKLAYISSRTHTDTGSNLGTFQFAWSMMFGH